MITIQFSGRLGNLLFQIAATIALALESGWEFQFDREYLKSDVFSELSPFFVNTPLEDAEEIHEHNPIITYEKRAKLIGFFQDYRIFDKWHDRIMELSGLLKKRDLVARSDKFRLPEGITVSVHIRRGDYADATCYHLLLNDYYYKNAVLNVASRFGLEHRVHFIVFCEPGDTQYASPIIDAMKTATDNAGYSTEYSLFGTYLTNEKAIEDWEEMMAMSLCDHHIIANSTFSWWGAYLNPNPRKIVCYPNQFYNHQLYYLTTDGFEIPTWTKISAWNPSVPKCGCDFSVYWY
jgi:hypothetical protein